MLLADGLEATLGAVYLDGGLEPARRLVVDRIMEPELARLKDEAIQLADPKTALQETLHLRGLPPITYTLIKEEGPGHRKIFTIEARLRSGNTRPTEFVGRAQASTKKSAEQAAARQVLEHLETSAAVSEESHV